MDTSFETREEAAAFSQICAYRNALIALWSYRVNNTEQSKQDSVLTLAKRVVELAEHQTSNGSAPQKELIGAIKRLQIAVEGPAHYVARMRHQVREHVCRYIYFRSLNIRVTANGVYQHPPCC